MYAGGKLLLFIRFDELVISEHFTPDIQWNVHYKNAMKYSGENRTEKSVKSHTWTWKEIIIIDSREKLMQ